MMTPTSRPAAAPNTGRRRDGGPRQDGHRGEHSEAGALRGEHPGRSRNPLIKVEDLAWLEFEKADLDAAQAFLADFGFTLVDRSPDMVRVRGHWAGTPCLVVRRGPRSRFLGPAFRAAAREDLDRVARSHGIGSFCTRSASDPPATYSITR